MDAQVHRGPEIGLAKSRLIRMPKVGLKAAQKEPDEEIMEKETREFLDSKFNAVPKNRH